MLLSTTTRKKLPITKIAALLFALVITLSTAFAGYPEDIFAAAATTAKIRFIFTTDLHGQVASIDAESGKSYPKGGLSKAYTLIKNARSEVNKDNYFTFDIGDVLYDYSTEFIMGRDPDAVQPIYQAMKTIGYDAVTLGNHDFDYGYEYIVNQLKGSGMSSKVIVSNVTDSKTGEHVFGNSKIITKTVKATNGKTMKVKVGIIGETIPKLSAKTESYTGVLKGEDIVDNTTSEAAALKEKGADIVVVLAHSGFGTDDPSPLSENVSYALTEIDDVDVVLCGHAHSQFPSTSDKSAAIYSMDGVNAKTGQINGKTVAMASDRGQSIGVADLTLQQKSSSIKVTKGTSQVRSVTSTTKADSKIASFIAEWEESFTHFAKEPIGTLAAGSAMNNYYGLVEDNSILQLLNNAKIDYATRVIAEQFPELSELPIIAGSEYDKYGNNNIQDYANLSGLITEADLSSLQSYKKYLALYKMTGKELKEWLEWVASAYETVDLTSTNPSEGWTNDDMKHMIESNHTPSLISEDWLDDWLNFMVIDGVSYTIDPSQKPKYNHSGTQINESSRISSLTYHGETIPDDMEFVFATNRITRVTDANRSVYAKQIYRSFNRLQTIVGQYITDLSKTENMNFQADNNWHVQLPDQYQFLVKGVNGSEKYAQNRSWYVRDLGEMNNYSYAIGCFDYNSEDKTGPNIVASPSSNVTTNQDILVKIYAEDPSGIQTIRYSTEDKGITYGTTVSNYQFKISANHTYYIYAEDKKGNVSRTVLNVNNINKDVLTVPKVDKYTNRKTTITGKAEPYAEIHFETQNGTYSSSVDADGKFSYALPSQKAGTTMQVYVTDLRGRTSDKVAVEVKRTGPNQVSVNEIANNSGTVTGNRNDSDGSIFVQIGDTVYVPGSSGSKLYKSSDKYNSKKTIKETAIKVKSNGDFSLTVPIQKAKTNVYVFSVDHVGRASKTETVQVYYAAPNKPSLNSVYSITHQISGIVKDAGGNEGTGSPSIGLGNDLSQRICQISVEVGGRTYTGTTDTNGYFTVETDALKNGAEYTVSASDTVNGKVRYSAKATGTIKNLTTYLESTQNNYVDFNDVWSGTSEIAGLCRDTSQTMYIYIGSEMYKPEINAAGNFTVKLDAPLAADTNIYAACFDKVTNKIKNAAYTTAKQAIPAKPKILDDPTTNSTQIRVSTTETCTMYLQVETNTYVNTTPVYDEELKAYVYTFQFEPGQLYTGDPIFAYGENGSGKSEYSDTKKVQYAAPDPSTTTSPDTTAGPSTTDPTAGTTAQQPAA